MNWTWHAPRDTSGESQRVGVLLLAVASLILFSSGLIAMIQSRTVGMWPTSETPDGNIFLTFILPAILMIITRYARKASPERFGVIVLVTCALTPLVTLSVNLESQDASVGAASFYFLPAIGVACLWSMRVVMIHTAHLSVIACIQFVAVDGWRFGLSKWLAVCLAMFAVAVAISGSRSAEVGIQKQYQWAIDHDSLTGATSRQRFDDIVEQLRHGFSPTGDGFMLVDADRLKALNDKYGHEVGDSYLKEVCSVLARHTPSGATLGRIGGDEFAMILPDYSAHSCQLIAEECSQAMQALSFTGPDGEHYPVSASFGLSHTLCGSTIDSLYRDADDALYHVKRTARGSVAVAWDHAAAAGSMRKTRSTPAMVPTGGNGGGDANIRSETS